MTTTLADKSAEFRTGYLAALADAATILASNGERGIKQWLIQTATGDDLPTATCRNCGYPIVDTNTYADPYWMHTDTDTGLALEAGRGCRSASFGRDGEWDDTLPAKAVATPRPGTVKGGRA